MPTTKNWREDFDKKFGKDGPEKDSDSEIERAGCDDCSENIRIRAEHKKFCASLLSQHTEEIIELLKKEKVYPSMSSDWTFNETIDFAVSRIHSLSESRNSNLSIQIGALAIGKIKVYTCIYD